MSFTDQFLDYAKDFTVCPPLFLRWSAKLCLSVIAGRNCVMRVGDWDIVPNIWMVLLGLTSAHKSTGLAIGRNLLKEVMPQSLLPQEYSQEMLLADIAANPHRCFIYDEASGFFAVLGQKYNPILKSALTSLWTAREYVRKTKTGGEIKIIDPYLCFGGASTPANFLGEQNNGSSGKEMSVLSGFLPRFFLIPYFTPTEKHIALPPPRDKMKRIALRDTLLDLVPTEEREYVYDSESRKMMEVWYDQTRKRGHTADPLVASFYGKMVDEHVHKLAILAALEVGVTVITPDILDGVFADLLQVEMSWPDILHKFTTRSWEVDRDRIIKVIRQSKVISLWDLGQKTHIHGKPLQYILDDLKSESSIFIEPKGEGRKAYKEVSWLGD